MINFTLHFMNSAKRITMSGMLARMCEILFGGSLGFIWFAPGMPFLIKLASFIIIVILFFLAIWATPARSTAKGNE